MKKIELFVYDFDGTLVNTKDDIAYSLNLVFRELGLPPLKHETVFLYIGDGVGALVSRALEGTGCDNVPEAVRLFKKFYEQHLTKDTRLYPHCRETVGFFVRKKHAILSNKPERFIKKILAEFDFLHPFAGIVGGDTLDGRKPDPLGLHYLMALHETTADKVLMVGDIAVDIETGKRACVTTCGVTYGLGGRSEVEEADYVIDDLSELKKYFH
ncbi:MAG: HAD family hydrolase [Nitrospinales bacterium]